MTDFERGKAQRRNVPRSSHASWSPPAQRADPIDILEAQETTRIANLLPIRHERMMRSPFAFYRGSAAIMAADLSHTPTTGASVQAGGDCHLANFGAYGTPERRLIFDVNDFDETLPSPWEWDIKRLATSAVLLGYDLGFNDSTGRTAAVGATRSYRETILRCARMTPLEVWNWRLDASTVIDDLQTARVAKKLQQVATNDASAAGDAGLTKLLEKTPSGVRVAENPPLVYHLPEQDPKNEQVREAVRLYGNSLRDDIRVLFKRYDMVDLALKVVGVGSVGTLCAIALLQSGDGVLLLQVKEATASVLEPYAGKSRYFNHGERVVTGQRIMQAASDMFLGWTKLQDGRHFYVRRFHDMKAGVDFTRMRIDDLFSYASLCGAALARGHARSADPSFIAGYLGSSSIFDETIGDFAVTYAEQTKRDYGLFLDAIKQGRLQRDVIGNSELLQTPPSQALN